MGRARLDMRYRENSQARLATYRARLKGLQKKARELSILCDVDVIFVSFSPELNDIQYWPENISDFQRIAERYRRLNPHSCKSSKEVSSVREEVEAIDSKLKEVRERILLLEKNLDSPLSPGEGMRQVMGLELQPSPTWSYMGDLDLELQPSPTSTSFAASYMEDWNTEIWNTSYSIDLGGMTAIDASQMPLNYVGADQPWMERIRLLEKNLDLSPGEGKRQVVGFDKHDHLLADFNPDFTSFVPPTSCCPPTPSALDDADPYLCLGDLDLDLQPSLTSASHAASYMEEWDIEWDAASLQPYSVDLGGMTAIDASQMPFNYVDADHHFS